MSVVDKLYEQSLERRNRSQIVRFGRIAVPVTIVLVWQVLGLLYPGSIASPAQTLDTLVRGIEQGWLLKSLEVSLLRLAIAVIIAVSIGIPIGLLLGMNKFWGEAYESILLSAYSTPKVVLLPLFLLAFGIGTKYLVAFAVFHGIFPVAIVIIGGVKNIREVHLRIAEIMQLSRWKTFREIIAPSMSLPLLIALRLGFNLTFLGLILGELFQSDAGLGFQLMDALTIVDTERIFAINVVIVVLAVGVNYAMYTVERRFSNRMDINAPEY